MAILISAHQLEKSFASRTLFRELTFAIESGDRIGLIGPNGAGKSTLMKILAKQMDLDSGQLSFQRGLRIGYLEQTPTFKPGITIHEALCENAEDPYDYEFLALVDTLLSKLELNQGNITADTLVENLSGGWRKRVALAKELAKNPDLLLLDEPTNHLDFHSILWLEEFLQDAPFALLTITHDRLFLQRVANRIFDLDRRNANGLLNIKGDYAQYVESKQQLMQAQEKQEEVLRNTLRRETEWLRRGAKARQTKQQARIQRAHQLKEDVGELQERNFTRNVGIDFQETERNPQKLINALEISKSYNGKNLFSNLNLLITPKTRLGLLGSNGAGKSTLIRILLGQEKPDSGEVSQADRLEVAYFEQHRDELKPELSLMKNICSEGDYVEFRGQYIFARSYLSRFLFRPEQMDLPVMKLSGGEQARLRIAQLMLRKANVLILDEPTNDLDLATLNVLEENLREFNGAVILVTHDRYFLDQVSNSILAFTKNAEDDPQLLQFANYLQWENWNSENLLNKKADFKKSASENSKTAPSKKKLSYKEQRELDSMEEEIQKVEAHLQKLQEEANAPENASKAQLLNELFLEIKKHQDQIEKLYQRWSILSS